MPIPKLHECCLPVLKVISDGEAHQARDVFLMVADYMRLSEEDRSEMIPSKKKSKVDSRINWAMFELLKAELLSRPGHGLYQITERGRQAIESGEKINEQIKLDNGFKESSWAKVKHMIFKESSSNEQKYQKQYFFSHILSYIQLRRVTIPMTHPSKWNRNLDS